jgi:hypothetical protein
MNETNHGVRMQVAYLDKASFKIFKEERLLPMNGAFIEVRVLPSSSVHGLMCLLNERLVALEAYRAASRRVPKRQHAITSIYAEWYAGHLTELLPGDAVVAGGNLRLRPTEDLALVDATDTSWFAMLPATTRENLAMRVTDRSALNEVSALMRSQFVAEPLRTLVAVMDW